MKLAVVVLVFAIALLGEIAAYSHYEETLAKFGVGDLGRGHEYVRIKKMRTQVVNGLMYYFKVVVDRNLLGGVNGKVDCNIQIWKKPDNFVRVESSECEEY